MLAFDDHEGTLYCDWWFLLVFKALYLKTVKKSRKHDFKYFKVLVSVNFSELPPFFLHSR